MKYRFFSLIEIMIVVLLVSLVSGVAIFSLIPLYQTYRFQLEVEAVYDLVQELQLEALTLQSDMTLSFTKEKEQWVATSSTNESVLKPRKIDLSHVDEIKAPLTFTFFSNGLIEPRKTVTFSYRDQKRGVDFSFPPLIKFWIDQPQKFENLTLPKLLKEKL